MRTSKREKQNLQLLTLFLLLFGMNAKAQNIPIDGWKMHLPYENCYYVTGSPTTIWAATNFGLFQLNKADNSVKRITKIDGLSDLEIGAIGYNSYNNVLVVGYQDGNVDLVRGNQITNLPDIKRAQVLASKDIYNIYFVGALAYLSTGFGIVVIDTDHNEVRDTYIIGPNGNYLPVYDVVSDGVTIYAGTQNGIYYAPINSAFLSNFTTWTKFIDAALPNGNFCGIALYDNKLFAAHDSLFPSSYGSNSVYYYDLSTLTWHRISVFNSSTVKGFYVRNNLLYLSDFGAVYVFGPNLAFLNTFSSYDGTQPHHLNPGQIYVDEQNYLWEADNKYGLMKMSSAITGQSFYPNGPAGTDAYQIAVQDQSLLVVPGGHDDAWNNVYNLEGVSNYNNSTWTSFDYNQFSALDSIKDFTCAAIDPVNPNHYFLGSWGWGIMEMNNGTIAHIWQDNNSTLRPKPEYHWVGIGDMKYDTLGNLWVVNSNVTTCLNVYKPDGTWQSFDFAGLISADETVSQLMITHTGKKWIILPRQQGMLVFDDKGTLSNTNDDSKRKLGFTAGIGMIPGTAVYSMAEDDDGNVWIGTDAGVAVFYCADNILTPSGCDAQQILITQDTYVNILLGTQIVTSIVVDGANRKWIGTDGGGVFLFSSDGQKQLDHFTSDTSPLLSDNITSMAMNRKTGEIYFGTTKGICSYRAEAIDGGDHMGDVYTFPNPVRPDYHGPIAITGLVKDADVKITDVRGEVVFKTTALGGQAIWDGNNFQGTRAATGVYLVFISNADGSEKAVTKILFIN